MREHGRTPIVVTHAGGLKFAARLGDHRLLLDQPGHAGGDDAGPAPLQLIGAGLASCVALYVQQYCESRGLPYEGMRVELMQFGAQTPARIGRFEVRVVLPEQLPGRHATVLEQVARSCPAHATLSHPADIRVTIEAGAAETSARA